MKHTDEMLQLFIKFLKFYKMALLETISAKKKNNNNFTWRPIKISTAKKYSFKKYQIAFKKYTLYSKIRIS